MSEQSRTRIARRPALALLVALAVFLSMSAVMWAATYVIGTNDGSVAEWSAQSIPVFQYDPAGDTPIATDDLIAAAVASADIQQSAGNVPGLAFRAEVAFPPAASQPARAVAALLDCDRNGLDTERQDRWVVYNTTGPRTDEVTLYTGDQYFGLVPTAVLPKFLGQRVLNQLEWAIPISELPIRGDEPPELGKVVDCRHEVDIRIATLQFVTPTGFIVLDTLTPPLGWDVSTGKPLSATLTISQAPEFPDDVRLDWNATAQSAEYILWRSPTGPYDGFAELARVPTPGYTDAGAAAAGETAYFYRAQGSSDGQTIDASNTVGLLTFSLSPGEAPPQ